MNEKGFRAFLKAGKRVPKGLTDSVIRGHIRLAKEFEEFIKKRSPGRKFDDADWRDVRQFLKLLMKDKRNTWDNLIGLLRYSRFEGNKDVELELLIILDGGDVLGKLLDAAKDELGDRRFGSLFAGFAPPPLGTPHEAMPEVTKDFMERLQTGTDTETSRAILLTGVHAGPAEFYADEKKMLRESEDIDEYLAKRRQKMIDLLENHMNEGTLFYTQAIDRKSLDFVRKNPEVAGGVRKGLYIFQTKIPYMMIEYLREKDPTKRRYYACHCPLARESIVTGTEIPRDFCYCSAGYEKKPYEVAFGEPVKTTVLKSVLWGDEVCRFKMKIPEKYRAGKGETRMTKTKRSVKRGKTK